MKSARVKFAQRPAAPAVSAPASAPGQLSEGAYALVATGMKRLSTTSNGLYEFLGILKQCKIHVDEDAFLRVTLALDEIHYDLQTSILNHINAIDGRQLH